MTNIKCVVINEDRFNSIKESLENLENLLLKNMFTNTNIKKTELIKIGRIKKELWTRWFRLLSISEDF